MFLDNFLAAHQLPQVLKNLVQFTYNHRWFWTILCQLTQLTRSEGRSQPLQMQVLQTSQDLADDDDLTTKWGAQSAPYNTTDYEEDDLNLNKCTSHNILVLLLPSILQKFSTCQVTDRQITLMDIIVNLSLNRTARATTQQLKRIMYIANDATFLESPRLHITSDLFIECQSCLPCLKWTNGLLKEYNLFCGVLEVPGENHKVFVSLIMEYEETLVRNAHLY